MVKDSGRTFPHFDLMSPGEVSLTRRRLSRSLGLSEESADKDIYDAFYKGTEAVEGFSMADDNALSDPHTMLHAAGVIADSLCIMLPLNSGLECGPRIERKDLVAYFDDIWFPMTDDLLVLNEPNGAAFFLDHHGHPKKFRYIE